MGRASEGQSGLVFRPLKTAGAVKGGFCMPLDAWVKLVPKPGLLSRGRMRGLCGLQPTSGASGSLGPSFPSPLPFACLFEEGMAHLAHWVTRTFISITHHSTFSHTGVRVPNTGTDVVQHRTQQVPRFYCALCDFFFCLSFGRGGCDLRRGEKRASLACALLHTPNPACLIPHLPGFCLLVFFRA